MSKGLEAFKNILNQELIKPKKYRETIKDIASVGQVVEVEKELKALEIIKKTLGIELYFCEELQQYLINIGGSVAYLLKSKDEYDLLKEVLGND